MSVPISTCLLAAAIHGRPGAQETLARRAADARHHGVSFFPCHHEARCPDPTAAELHSLAITIPDLAPLVTALTTPAEEALALNSQP